MRRIVFVIATIIVSPALFWQWFFGSCMGRDSTLEGTGQLLAMIPGRIGASLRSAFYYYVLEECHPSVLIGYGTLISKTATRLGPNVYIGPYCILGLVSIQRDTLIGPAVQIPSGKRMHLFDCLDMPIRNQGGEVQRVSIGADCWIGGGCIVMANIGDQSVVGAGSVVTKPIDAKVVAAGSPAKKIRDRGGLLKEVL